MPSLRAADALLNLFDLAAYFSEELKRLFVKLQGGNNACLDFSADSSPRFIRSSLDRFPFGWIEANTKLLPLFACFFWRPSHTNHLE